MNLPVLSSISRAGESRLHFDTFYYWIGNRFSFLKPRSSFIKLLDFKIVDFRQPENTLILVLLGQVS